MESLCGCISACSPTRDESVVEKRRFVISGQ
nr:MAG TPA: hypothetical protein [Caudoviricetes sp.]